MTLLRNTQSIAWQAALARQTARIARNRTRFEADVAAKVAIWTQAAEEKADRAQANLLKQRGFERWCADYLTSPAYRLLPPGPKVEAQPEPAAEAVTIDAAARFLVQHPVEVEQELAAVASTETTVNPEWLDDWKLANGAAPDDPRLKRFHYDDNPERQEYNYYAPPMTQKVVTTPKGIGAIITEMMSRDDGPLPTHIYRTRTRDDEVEDAPELVFVKWTNERLYYREAPGAALERFWGRATVQKMLAVGTLQIRGPRPAWARPLERHEREVKAA